MSLEEEDKFYGDAKKYWEGITPTVDGMLGGFAKISPTDINGSHAFLRPFLVVGTLDLLTLQFNSDCFISTYFMNFHFKEPLYHIFHKLY